MKFCPTCKSKFPTDINYCPNDATKLVNDPEAGPSHSLIGMILDNRYQIMSKLGEGGMGSVYAAEHILLKKNVAIKVLRYDLARKEDVVKRFQNEAIAASRIGHENIIEVTDFGRTPDGSVYFVMEHLNGLALADVIQKSGSIPMKRAIPILLQITKALSVAHSQGIIHRDLKPENIVLIDKPDRKDFVKILDFGISKMLDTSDRAEKLTAMGMIVGTPEYMSPEQAAGMSVDKRTDIYSLGVIMYEMMTGRLPFLADNAIRILMMHQTEKPQRPREINPEIHNQMEQIILKCMEKKPEDRFQDMTEITQALIQLLSSSARAVEPKKTIAFNPQQVISANQEVAVPSVPINSTTLPPRSTAQYNSGEMASVVTQQSLSTQSASTINRPETSVQTKKTISGNINVAASVSGPENVSSEQAVVEEESKNKYSSQEIVQQDSTPNQVISTDEYEETITTKGGTNKGVVIAIVVIVLIIIGGGLFLFLKGGDNEQERKTSEQVLAVQTTPIANEQKKEEPKEEKKQEEPVLGNKEKAEDTQTEKKEEKVSSEKSIKTAKAVDGIVLNIVSDPENVEIYKGGTLMGVTPYQLKGKKNSSQEFLFKKAGFEPLKKRLVFDSSKDMKVQLKKIEEKKKGTPQKEKDPFEKIDDLKDLSF